MSDNNLHRTNVYILKLESDIYYVGKTDNIERRYEEHLEGNGSVWTKLYKPIKIEEICLDVSPFEEDKKVKEYMSVYGIDNVRGGSYVSKELTQEEKYLLDRELKNGKDLCFNCGDNSHSVKDCDDNRNAEDNKEINTNLESKNFISDVIEDLNSFNNNLSNNLIPNLDSADSNNNLNHPDQPASQNKIIIIKEIKYIPGRKRPRDEDRLFCSRCGRDNHLVDTCYAKTLLTGELINSDEDDYSDYSSDSSEGIFDDYNYDYDGSDDYYF